MGFYQENNTLSDLTIPKNPGSTYDAISKNRHAPTILRILFETSPSWLFIF